MIVFLAMAAVSILVAVLQARDRRFLGSGPARSALLLGGCAYLAAWLAPAILYEIARASAAARSALPTLYLIQSVILAGLSLVLWTALSRLLFAGAERRDLLYIVPFGLLSIAAGAGWGMMPATSALLALPLLLRVRWRKELAPGTLGLASLFGALFVLLRFVELKVHPGPEQITAAGAALDRYAGWMRDLAALHILVALPRLLWGMNLPIRSVKRRLLWSHVLTGVVPIALVLIFWGLSTYLSVTADRARIAGRHLAGEVRELGSALEAAMARPEEARGALAAWGRLEATAFPGLRIWVRSAESPDSLARVYGDPVPEEHALAAWPAAMGNQGVVLLGGRSFIGAVHRSGRGRADAAVLIPSTSFLGESFRSRLDADAYLETRFVVRSARGEFAVSPATSESSSQEPDASGAATHGPSTGAALVPAFEWSDGSWHERMVLLWARVGFFSSFRGLARNVQGNPFNLIPLVFLGIVAVLFVLVEILTLGMVISMGKSILRALNALRVGTSRLRSGNLRYRIPIEGDDDLWAVAESFNEMTSDLDQARDLEIERERLEGELDLARQIQARLLPGDIPPVPMTDVAGLSVPARHVGGDYYDLIPVGPHRVALIVADVSGKGIPAALLMSSFRASLLSRDLEREGPAHTLTRLNAFLHRSVEPGRFVTAFLAVLDASDGRLSYANAGHDPPILIRGDEEPQFLRDGGLILGLFGDSVYQQSEIRLERGDLLALYTDGVTEARNEEDEFWGLERLIASLQQYRNEDCRSILREILGDVRSFAGERGQSDDITLLLAHWRGPGARSPHEGAATAAATVSGSAAPGGSGPVSGPE